MSQPARFCIRCGAAVPVTDSRFCFSCGAEIVSPGLIAEQSPLPTQEPHEEPPAAPPPSSNLGTEPQSSAIDPVQAVVSGFTRCMELGGRSSRSEFWWFYLFTGSASLLTLVMAALIGTVVGVGAGVTAFIFLNVLISWPYIAVGVRRLHDSGRNGWLILIGLVPLFGWIVVLVWWVSPSNEGSNRYGPNPNQRSQNPRHTPDRETQAVRHPTPEHRIPPEVYGDESNWPALIAAGVLLVIVFVVLAVVASVG